MGASLILEARAKLAEYWNVTDNVDMFKQIGAIEITEKEKELFPDKAK